MQKLELNKVHVLEKIPGTAMFRLGRTQPALRLCRKDEVVYIQKGMLFDQGGNPLSKDQTPGWLADELKSVNPAVLKECGYSPKGA